MASPPATLLPNGEQVFLDANGFPLAMGTVQFYVPYTNDPKDTWQDPSQFSLNTNPVNLDAAGRAVIYGVGMYRQVVKDVDGNTMWDQLTSANIQPFEWGGVSGGIPNAQTLNLTDWAATDGALVDFIASGSNTGPLSVKPSAASAAIPVAVSSATGPSALIGGEVIINNPVQLLYSAANGTFYLLNPVTVPANPILSKPPSGAYSNLAINVTSNVLVNITADQIVLANGVTSCVTLSANNVTANISTNGANGLDTGNVASNTWYNVFVIFNIATATKAALLSLSATAPTLPAGYTYVKRVGAVRTDSGTTNLLRTKQLQDRVQYIIGTLPTALPRIVSQTGTSGDPTLPTWIAASISSFVPPTAYEIALMAFAGQNGAAGGTSMSLIVAPNNLYGAGTGSALIPAANPPPIVLNYNSLTNNVSDSIAQTAQWLIESSNIYYASSKSGGGTFQFVVGCLGWRDQL